MKLQNRLVSLALCVIVGAASLMLGGCLSVDKDNRVSFELAGDGTVRQVIVDDADKSVTGEELENYITENINSFGSQNEGESVALENCRVSGGKVNITLVYSSVAAYAAFNNVSCFNGTVKEAYDAGYDFNREFYAMNGVALQYYELPRYCEGRKLLILQEAVEVSLPGELFALSDGVTVDGSSIKTDENPDESYDAAYQATLASPVFLIYDEQ